MSSSSFKLSLPIATLININITLGSGIFINTFILTKYAGALSGFTYALIGILLLPLILTFTQLLRRYPAGGFYTFGQQGISPLIGFLSAWSYFVGKLTSTIMALHAAMSLLQTLFPTLQHFSTLSLDVFVIIIYTLLNMLNVQQGSQIQVAFTAIKMIPIFFIVFSGFFLIQPANLAAPNFIWNGFLATIPLALYTFYGFEAACSISQLIDKPEKNAWKALLISHLVATGIIILFQIFLYAGSGPEIRLFGNSYLNTFPIFIHTCFSALSPIAKAKLIGIMHIAIVSSALGSSYGVIYSNGWNLHILAKHKHTFFSNALSRLNSNFVPYWCIICEALICFGYLILTRGNQLALQQTGVFALTFTYLLSVLAYWAVTKRAGNGQLLPVVSLGIVLFLLIMCLRNFILLGILPLISFSAVLFFGYWMFKSTPGRFTKPLSNLDRD